MHSESYFSIIEVLEKAYKLMDQRGMTECYINSEMEWPIYNENPHYVSDGKICIMVDYIQGTSDLLSSATPYNTLRTKFYNVYKGCQKVMNCTQETLDKTDTTQTYPLPYSPYYHYKLRFPEFKQQRTKVKDNNFNCRVIHLEKWKVMLVNIANSGFYAPIFYIQKFRLVDSYKRLTFGSISNVIFHPNTINKMLTLYHKHVREFHVKFNKRNNDDVTSLCATIFSKTNIPTGYDIDFRRKLLKCPQTNPDNIAYVFMGDEAPKGEVFLKQPLNISSKNLPQPATYVSPSMLNPKANKVNKEFYRQLNDKQLDQCSEDPLESYREMGNSEEESLGILDSQQEEEQDEDSNYLAKLYRKMLSTDTVPNYPERLGWGEPEQQGNCTDSEEQSPLEPIIQEQSQPHQQQAPDNKISMEIQKSQPVPSVVFQSEAQIAQQQQLSGQKKVKRQMPG